MGASEHDGDMPGKLRGHVKHGRESPEGLRSERDAIEMRYAEFKTHVYFDVQLNKTEGYFRPGKLPTARSLPPISEVFNPKSEIPLPASRALCMVVHHRRWLECLDAAL